MYLQRLIEKSVRATLERKSILLLGPRQTGKTTFIKNQVSADKTYNLLNQQTFAQISARPSLIRESLGTNDKLIVIDEIQKLPSLMDEVHLMIEDTGVRFLLTGSSARKLRRTYTKLMAGRVRLMYLHPLVSAEIPEFDLQRVLRLGSLPPFVASPDPFNDLLDYVGEYLQQEILAEALTRGIEQYSRFLNQVATVNAKILNLDKVANDSQVSPTTVRRYLDVLTDTLIAYLVEPWRKGSKRKAVAAPKIYFFDIGVVNALTGLQAIGENHPICGELFEHFIFLELLAYRDYCDRQMEINYWRVQEKLEVDFVVNSSTAIEVKASRLVSERDLKGLAAIADEVKLKRRIIVSRDTNKRKLGGIEVYPYRDFLAELWAGELVF